MGAWRSVVIRERGKGKMRKSTFYESGFHSTIVAHLISTRKAAIVICLISLNKAESRKFPIRGAQSDKKRLPPQPENTPQERQHPPPPSLNHILSPPLTLIALSQYHLCLSVRQLFHFFSYYFKPTGSFYGHVGIVSTRRNTTCVFLPLAAWFTGGSWTWGLLQLFSLEVTMGEI